MPTWVEVAEWLESGAEEPACDPEAWEVLKRAARGARRNAEVEG
jgi:hypothetical protein